MGAMGGSGTGWADAVAAAEGEDKNGFLSTARGDESGSGSEELRGKNNNSGNAGGGGDGEDLLFDRVAYDGLS